MIRHHPCLHNMNKDVERKTNPTYLPSALTVSWKSDHQKHHQKISFGASLISTTKTKDKLLDLRQTFNQCMLPRDADGNLMMKLTPWDFCNCAETNTYFYLSQWRGQFVRIHKKEWIHATIV